MQRRRSVGASGIGRMALLALGAFLWAVAVRATPLDGSSGRGVHLLMIEQSGCYYCERWHEEVGIGYDKTGEGRFAPLVRMSIADRRGDGLGPVNYTPTFLLVRDGREVGRITGYISEDFFWGMLAPLLQEQGFAPAGGDRPI